MLIPLKKDVGVQLRKDETSGFLYHNTIYLAKEVYISPNDNIMFRFKIGNEDCNFYVSRFDFINAEDKQMIDDLKVLYQIINDIDKELKIK